MFKNKDCKPKAFKKKKRCDECLPCEPIVTYCYQLSESETSDLRVRCFSSQNFSKLYLCGEFYHLVNEVGEVEIYPFQHCIL